MAEKTFIQKVREAPGVLITGLIAGAIICMVTGFMWGGWVTGGTSAKNVAAAATEAKVAALAPLCAEQFQAQEGASTKLAALKGESTWSRSGVVEKSGFANFSTTVKDGKTVKAADSDVARACAELLASLPAPKT